MLTRVNHQSYLAKAAMFLLAATSLNTSVEALAQTVITEGTNLGIDVSSVDGQIAMDLLGSIWILPQRGGQAQPLDNVVMPARRPRWSPSSEEILYEVAGATGTQIWVHDLLGGTSRLLSQQYSDQQASWHPAGDRIVFSAPGENGSLDLWELDLPTGLRWRISHDSGEETEPAWSGNGRHLVYVRYDGDAWSLMLRRRGSSETELFRSEQPLRAPSWRPDGSLITFLRADGDRYAMSMVILSDPPIVRNYSDDEQDFFLTPVSWQDRQRMVYAADGRILARRFGDRRARPVQFRAALQNKMPSRDSAIATDRDLPVISAPEERLVIRAARIFDGLGSTYRNRVDVVVEGGIIVEVAQRRDRKGETVLDLGRTTLLPGFVDLYSAMPGSRATPAGSGLLAFGVTTLVTDEAASGIEEWHGERNPGPRIIGAAELASARPTAPHSYYLATLPRGTVLAERPQEWVRNWQQAGIPVLADNWTVGLGLGVDLLLGADVLPRSPGGRQYQDMRIVASGGPVTLVSGLADSSTPGINALLSSRQAVALGHGGATMRRSAISPQLDGRAASVVAGSKPSGLPAGLALHAELLALQAAGLDGYQVLQAAGINAARVLGVEGQLGRIASGALADMVLVNGDPLNDIADSLNIVAVVRNGRFFSLVSLLEHATTVENVEYFDKSDNTSARIVTN